MKFFDLETCKQLEAMGCISESEIDHDGDLVQAFIEQDFTGSSAQAKANAKIVWPTEHTTKKRERFAISYTCQNCNTILLYDYLDWSGYNCATSHRMNMIDSNDGIAYLTNYLKENK